MDEREKYTAHFILTAAFIVCVYMILYRVLDQGVFSHSDYDSYTRQAAAWWQGSANLPENIFWLEIAEFGGRYYVSFPPFPSVVQFLLILFFGMNTPDNLINTLFALGAFVLIYRFLMRQGCGGFTASMVALLATLGTNLLYLSLTGWVWFSAQTQAFFFSVLSVFLMYSKRPAAWAFAFLSLGLAFACRPFQIVYLPLLLYLLYQNLGKKDRLWSALTSGLKYVLPLALVGACVAAYNYVRFGNVFEFGHNYLPEFSTSPQFSLSYVPGNFLEILKLPGPQNGELFWPQFNGTLFFLVNPVYILLGVSLLRQRFGAKQAIYAACLVVHFILTLSHKTMGGWQFGTRYLVDMVPFMLVVFAGDPAFKSGRATKEAVLPAVLAAIGVAVNIWGAVWYYPQML